MNFTFNEYDAQAGKTAIYPGHRRNLIYPALKLAGEAGEVAEKVGKLLRDKGYVPMFNDEYPTDDKYIINMDDRNELIKELGDVLWYLSALATELDTSLEAIARANIRKLADRAKRDVLGGSGDNR